MKKLKLKLDGMKEMLTKEQMKKISGGYGGVKCWNCYVVYSLSCGGGDSSYQCCDTAQNCAYSQSGDPCIVDSYCD